MEPIKMPRAKRAAQFAPFDALKGLNEALKLKEIEHERIIRGELSEDSAAAISDALLSCGKGCSVKIEFFREGKILSQTGKFFPRYEEGKIDLKSQEGKITIFVSELLNVQLL